MYNTKVQFALEFVTIQSCQLGYLPEIFMAVSVITARHLILFIIRSLFCIGYSIFVVTGVLPTCEADQLLSLIPYMPSPPPPPSSSHTHKRATPPVNQEDEDLAEAIALSLVGK